MTRVPGAHRGHGPRASCTSAGWPATWCCCGSCRRPLGGDDALGARLVFLRGAGHLELRHRRLPGRRRGRAAPAAAADQPRARPSRAPWAGSSAAPAAGWLCATALRAVHHAAGRHRCWAWRPAWSAQLGDLVESMLKRDVGLKDSARAPARPRRHPRPVRFAAVHRAGRLLLLPLLHLLSRDGRGKVPSMSRSDRARPAPRPLYPFRRRARALPAPLRLVVLGATGSHRRADAGPGARAIPTACRWPAVSCREPRGGTGGAAGAACGGQPGRAAAAGRGGRPAAARARAAGRPGWRGRLLPPGAAGLVEAAAGPRRDCRGQRPGRRGGAGADAGRGGARPAHRPGEQGIAGGGRRPGGARPSRRGGAELLPVDSEHSAIAQCLAGRARRRSARLILTASGGPFRDDAGRARWPRVTLAEVLAHPTWSMGPKITVDSATLMNKGLEVIEAHHLFGAAVRPDRRGGAPRVVGAFAGGVRRRRRAGADGRAGHADAVAVRHQPASGIGRWPRSG